MSASEQDPTVVGQAPGDDVPSEREALLEEIALRLGISAKTVEAHVSAVLRKLQLSSRHELTRWATDRRLA